MVDGLWKKATDAVCNNGFIRGAADLLVPIFTDISFTGERVLHCIRCCGH